MSSTLTKVSAISSPNLMKRLLVTVFLSIAALSIKTAYDLTGHSAIFPAWFVPGFVLMIMILIALSLYFVLEARNTENTLPLITSKQSTILWILMLLSFVCTTSVHGFYPFHRNVLLILPTVDAVMKTNYAIGILGFAACAIFAYAYLAGQFKRPAMIGLLLISLGMLIPNDNCANPFNHWWIETIGASPLMYVPNMYAALFVTSGLYGIRPKSAGLLTAGICLGSLLLGLGHQLGIIW